MSNDFWISVAEHRRPRSGVLGSIPGNCQPFHFPLEARLPHLSSHHSHLLLKGWSVKPFVSLDKQKSDLSMKHHKMHIIQDFRNNLFLYKFELWRSNTQIISWEPVVSWKINAHRELSSQLALPEKLLGVTTMVCVYIRRANNYSSTN